LAAHAALETLLAIQIETPQALAEVEEIAALEGVDMLFVGPSDMRLRLQYLPKEERPSLQEAIEKVAAAATKYNKPWGSMPRTMEQLRELSEMGARIHVWGTDIVLLRNGLKQSRADLDAIL
jgi:2-keto-3-deoxy-L-rhamnonate aldolase RhmA